jgi:addiction module HigA family antidote
VGRLDEMAESAARENAVLESAARLGAAPVSAARACDALFATARAGEPPGFAMRRRLEQLQMSQQTLALRAGCSLTPVNEVLCGRRRLTPRMASRLVPVLGGSVRDWLRLQADHDAAQVERAPR